MASELTLNATFAYDDGVDDVALQIVDLLVTLGTTKINRIMQTIGTSEEAVGLGEITSPGYVILVNRDATNYIDVKVATGGALFARLDPDTDSDGKGGFCILKLGSGAQAPYAIANTAACKMAGLICSL